MAKVLRPVFTVKKRVTEQLIKIERDVEYFIRADEPIYKAKPDVKSRSAAPDAQKKEPPHLMKVTMLDTGEKGVIIVPTVLKTELEDNYEGASYVGCSFRVVKHRLEGKGYNTFDIAEIEFNGEFEEVEEASEAAGVTEVTVDDDDTEDGDASEDTEDKPVAKRRRRG